MIVSNNNDIMKTLFSKHQDSCPDVQNVSCSLNIRRIYSSSDHLKNITHSNVLPFCSFSVFNLKRVI